MFEMIIRKNYSSMMNLENWKVIFNVKTLHLHYINCNVKKKN